MGGFVVGRLDYMGIVKPAMTLSVSGYREMMRDLRAIEPGLVTEMRREVRRIGNPVRDAIRSGIPKTAPLTNMTNKVGRLSWGTTGGGKVAANKTVLNTRVPRRKAKEGTSLVKIISSSPATVMADMAGRSGRYIGEKPYATGVKSNSMPIVRGKYKGEMGYRYTYRDGTVSGRKHRNTGGQGRGMIQNLGVRPSRFVYPAAAKGIGPARREIALVVNKYIQIVNRNKR